jgi:siroheme synthase-like protein
MRYYPIHLDLRGRLVAVIGGGAVAQEKVEGLLAAGARVKVVAPGLTPELARLAAEGAVEHVARSFRDGDLEGAFLAVGERLGAAIDGAVWREAEARGIPCNVQDDLPHCSFIAASVVRQGDLTVTISTSGKAPALAVRLRQQLERQLGAHYARFLEIAGRLRAPLAERLPDSAARRELWYRLVDSDVLELLGRGDDAGARERVAEITGVALAEARP